MAFGFLALLAALNQAFWACALPLLAGAGVAAVIASAVFLAVRWYRTSVGALAVSVAVYAPFAVLFAELSD